LEAQKEERGNPLAGATNTPATTIDIQPAYSAISAVKIQDTTVSNPHHAFLCT
jgi:hypothetical protein